MLRVAFRMKLEVRRAGRFAREAVVLDQALELRPGNVGLAGLDGVEDRARLERVVPAPGSRAFARLRERGSVERCVERGGEVVPESDVSRLLSSMLGVPSRSGGSGERDYRMTVFARVEGELVAAQLATLPAEIKRMVEDVPACADLVNALDQIHVAPFCDATPRIR